MRPGMRRGPKKGWGWTGPQEGWDMCMDATLSKKEEAFRRFALNGPMGKVIFTVCAPLALYHSLNQAFKILDAMMAAHISPLAVSAVSYLSQIDLALSALGSGLAVGASIKVSEAYGAGDMELVKRRISTLFALCAGLGGLLLLLLVPGAVPFLRMMKTPEEFIAEGSVYFILDLFGLVITFFNHIYMAIARAKGDSSKILYLNIGVILAKLSLTAWFVYGCGGGIDMIAVATILSQGLLFAAGMIDLNRKGSAFGFSLRVVSVERTVVEPMVLLALPVMVEKIAFSMGKVVVNSMSTVYGALTVGALGISNNIGGITTTPQDGIQEGGAAVISQNLGGGKPERALAAFWWMLAVNVGLGAAIVSLVLLFLTQIAHFFAGDEAEFAEMIRQIYCFEALGAVPLGVNAAVQGLLYGFGKTKLTLFVNFCRVFVFRIPLLWALQRFTALGSESVGIVMGVSNLSIGILSLTIGLYEVRKIRREYGLTVRKGRLAAFMG